MIFQFVHPNFPTSSLILHFSISFSHVFPDFHMFSADFPVGFWSSSPPQPGQDAGIQCCRRRRLSRRPRPTKRGKDLPPGCPRPRPGGQAEFKGNLPSKKMMKLGEWTQKKIGNWPRSKGKFWRNCGKWSYKHDDFTNKNDDFTENVGFNQNTWSFNQERRPNKNNEEISPWKPGFQQPTGNTSCLRR